MAMWTRAQQLPESSMQEIRTIYGDNFPIEVRHYLAHWIEDNIRTDIRPDYYPQYEQYVSTLLNTFIQEIENKSASFSGEENVIIKFKLQDAAKMFRERLSNPLHLFDYVRSCLATEYGITQTALTGGENQGAPGAGNVPCMSDIAAEMLRNIEVLRRRTHATAEKLRAMEQEQEAFTIQYHECTKLNATITQLSTQPQNTANTQMLQKIGRQKEAMEAMLNQKVAGLIQGRIAVVDKLKETYTMLNQVQSKVLDEELIHWKREQQLAGNGSSFNSNLDEIQGWCESLAEIIWLNRQQVKDLDRLKVKLPLDQPGVMDLLPSLLQDVTQLLSTLVTSTFIIEKQPPQVMKTNTRFTAMVRLLVGGKLNVHMTPPQVKVAIISESQANVLLKNDKVGKNGDCSGEILNNTGTMEYQASTRQLSVSFRNMQLKKIKRAEKKGTESVMDEKFSLLFQSQFSVGGGELMFQVWTLSLPVVVIVHGNQEPHAWATVTWDNAFCEPARVPFVVPDKVPWCKVAETLSIKFRAATGRDLTAENQTFLGQKAFRGNFTDINQLLTWAQFCKEPLTDRNFTFWEWFYAVMKLTREHLRGHWVDGVIMGFVPKKQAEEMLSARPSGTFLLRFSDSELGGVTIAWVSDTAEVFMIQPFTSKDFVIRSLADRIRDLGHLVCLFPDTAKDSAFNKYYTPFQESQPTSSNGYVKPLLVTHIPGVPSAFGSMSYPNTPQHPFASPDPSRDTPSVASSYGGSVSTLPPGGVTNNGAGVGAGGSGGMEYLDQFDDVNLDLNGLMSLSDFANYRQ